MSFNNLNMKGFQYVLIASLIVSSAAVRLEECVSGEVEVVENSASLTLTCSQYTGTVTWTYISTIIGECSSTCTKRPGRPPFFSLTRLSDSSSRLTVTLTTRDVGGIVYSCGNDAGGVNCTADVVVPAVLSTAALTFTRADSGWTIQGSSDVTTVYSSVGRYSCQWFHRVGAGQESTIAGSDVTLTLSPDPSDTSNTQNRSGRCSFSTTFPTSPGTHNYRVMVSPGNTDSNGIIQIATPSVPTVSCSPSLYVPENTDVSCTCNTQNVGQPEGRLTWFSGSIINSGNYGERTLEMTPQNITRAGGDVQLRCDVDWATRITGQTHTALVSYGPSQVTIPESSTFYTDSSGSIDLTLTCTASDVTPTTGLTYTWTGRCDHVTTRTCTFKPRPPGSSGGNDVNAAITCRVSNPSNNNVYKQGNFRLDLKYPPSSPPQIVGYTHGHVLYKGDSLNLTCTVTGGDPSVTSVTLTCPGHHDKGATSGQSSSLIISSLSATDHGINCRCSGQWTRPSYYNLTDSRTLTVYYSPERIKLTLRDVTGNLTVSEGDAVVLACLADGRPTPDMTLVKKETGREVHSIAGGDLVVEDRDSWLNYTITSAQCTDTGTYTCTAGNNVGTGLADTGAIFVNCTPRYAGPPPVDMPSVNYMNQSVHLTFNLWALPVPDSYHFLYLGQFGNETTATITNIDFDVQFLVAGELFNVTCVVTVVKMTAASAAGFYSLTVSNTLGKTQLAFQVKYNEEMPDRDKQDGGSEGLSTGAAVAVTLAVVVVVMVTAFLVWVWRRQWILPCANRDAALRTLDDRSRGQVVRMNSIEGNIGAEPTDNEGQPPSVYEDLKTGEVGLTSTYSTLQPYENVGSGRHKDHVYENSASPAYVDVTLDK